MHIWKNYKGEQEKREKTVSYCFCMEQRRRLLHWTEGSEITAIPLLETIQIKGSVVTIDAMGTQTAIAEKIKSRHTDLYTCGKRKPENII